MNGRIVPVVVALASVLAACGDGEVPAASAGPCGTVTNDAGGAAPPDPRAVRGDTRLVFGSGGDVFVHDVHTLQTTPLTGDGLGLKRSRPGLRDDSTISFVVQWAPADDVEIWGKDAVRLAPPGSATSGSSGELLRAGGAIWASDWDPSGDRLAYLVESGRSGRHAVCVLDTRTDGITLAKEFVGAGGRHVWQYDEYDLAWSSDGSALLVTDTFVDANKSRGTVFVLDLDGKDLVTPVLGTFARWLPDGRILVRDYEGEDLAWHALDIATNERTTLRLDGARFRPWVSPDGAEVAFDDGAETPSIFIAKVATGESRLLVRGYAGPVWLSRSPSIAATKTEPCSKDVCDFAPWQATTAGARIALDGEISPVETMVTLPDGLSPNTDVL